MKFKSFVLAAVMGLAATAASADVLEVGGGWSTFNFGNAGFGWSTSYEFTLTEAARLQVSDYLTAGDQFAVYNFGELLGYTSEPLNQSDWTADLDHAAQNPVWSSGTFFLEAGSYRITGIAVLSPHELGTAGIQLLPVPEPETYALMALGLGAVAFARARRKA